MPRTPRDGSSLLATLEGGPDRCRHGVQFYESVRYLTSIVADFVTAGLNAGRGSVIIATPEHSREILAALRAADTPVDTYLQTGRILVVDAAALLERFAPAEGFDPEHFRAVVTELLASAGGPVDEPLCVFGEMVDLLVERGDPDAAVRLEAAWSALRDVRPYTLLCAYPMRRFSEAADSDHFLQICRSHDHVLPTETYVVADEPGRSLELTRLQQRAVALESEIERGRSLEVRLRDSITDKERLLDRERAARAEAEDANRAKRDFLAMMSHELRTPLNAISGYADLLEMGVAGPVNDAQRDYLERIQRSQRRLLELIDEVLLYARSEAGRIRYEIGDFTLADVFHAVELHMLPQVQEKGIEYGLVVRNPGLVARADREKVQHILINLVANAVKFTERGGSISVSCEATEGEILISVRDTGIGIPADKRDTIFKPFVQVDSRLTRAHEGAGLGLSIGREFARGMGGDLFISPMECRGSTFVLSVPRA